MSYHRSDPSYDAASEAVTTASSFIEMHCNTEPPLRCDPFATPARSQATSVLTSPIDVGLTGRSRYFRSRRITKGTAARPWLDVKNPKEKWVTILPLISLGLGLCFAGFLVAQGYMSVEKSEFCPVLMEDWSSGFNKAMWTKEVEVGGFSNGQFEQTTNTDENSFIQDGALHIKPTLQDPALIEKNTVINLLKEGTCSSNTWANCVATTNVTNGTIVNPVKSARISTKASIKYGRVEVTAKLPAGDWLWPAIWMLPAKDTYGPWPASGEIDILESRGNNWTYAQGGNDIASSTLHWGPDPVNDAWYQNNNKLQALRTTYSSGFNTFGLEWNEHYIFTYINSRLMQVMYVNFNKPFWSKGKFPPSDSNGTRLVDPWSSTGRLATPFDQEFYLILNVAVGGTNGWFEDGKSGKPWADQSDWAKKDFWAARDSWYPTWKDNGEMIVKSVKMWQLKGYGDCR